MSRPFREHHILTILYDYEEQSLPLDVFLRNYCKVHKSLGSNDRAIIAETIYGMIRWRGLVDFICRPPATWEKRFDFYSSPEFEEAKKRTDIPDHVRLSFPRIIFDPLVASHGLEKAIEICHISNQQAPTTIRINTLKTTRDEMLARWKNTYKIHPCSLAENGIVFEKRENFFGMEEFKSGLFEIQDEGSQLLASLVQAEPGQQVMDYCAGAGGKTLAFAPRMLNKGQVFLHDIRKFALEDSKKRLRRAGIQNSQIVYENDVKLKKLKKNMDWVLVDAPCTGTGTMRRNPDMKWRFDDEMIERLVGQQRTIFEKALSYMKPTGKIVFSTCSVLKEENKLQVEHFLKTYQLVVVGDVFESLPVAGGMDGFFGAVLQRKY